MRAGQIGFASSLKNALISFARFRLWREAIDFTRRFPVRRDLAFDENVLAAAGSESSGSSVESGISISAIKM